MRNTDQIRRGFAKLLLEEGYQSVMTDDDPPKWEDVVIYALQSISMSEGEDNNVREGASEHIDAVAKLIQSIPKEEVLSKEALKAYA